jgi:hypothetical protein
VQGEDEKKTLRDRVTRLEALLEAKHAAIPNKSKVIENDEDSDSDSVGSVGTAGDHGVEMQAPLMTVLGQSMVSSLVKNIYDLFFNARLLSLTIGRKTLN